MGDSMGKEILQAGFEKIRRTAQRGGVAPSGNSHGSKQALVVRLTSKLDLDRMKSFFVQCTVVSSMPPLHTPVKRCPSLVLWHMPSFAPLAFLAPKIVYSSSNPVGLGLSPLGTGYVRGIFAMGSSPRYRLMGGTATTTAGPMHPTTML
jgi:hypothetical protein